MRKSALRVATLPLVAAVLAAACRPDDQPTRSIDPDAAERTRAELPAELVENLDSGNAAYRAHDFELARERYRAAVAFDSSSTAAWFGVFIAERALGNAEAAEEALKRARDLAPGASLIHGEEDDG